MWALSLIHRREGKDAQTVALGQKCRSVLFKSDVSAAVVIRVVLKIRSHGGFFGIVILMHNVFCIPNSSQKSGCRGGGVVGGC